jgi:hypothetical protein
MSLITHISRGQRLRGVSTVARTIDDHVFNLVAIDDAITEGDNAEWAILRSAYTALTGGDSITLVVADTGTSAAADFTNTLDTDVANAISGLTGVAYNSGTNTLTFTAGAPVDVIISRPTERDSSIENTGGVDETAILTISSASSGTIVAPTATITISDYDDSPNAFSFEDITNALLSTVYTPVAAYTVSGLADGVSAAITIVGGTYSKNGAAQTADAGTVVNGDTVLPQATSSAIASTETDVVVTIGGVLMPWRITTAESVITTDIEDHVFTLTISPTFYDEGDTPNWQIVRTGYTLQDADSITVVFGQSAGDADIDIDFENTFNVDMAAAVAAVSGVTWTSATRTLTFTAGAPTTLNIPRTIQGDTADGGADLTETVTMQLSSASHGTITDPAAVTIAIMDNPAVLLRDGSTFLGTTINENTVAGTNLFTLTVTGGNGPYTLSFIDDGGGAFAFTGDNGNIVETNTAFDHSVRPSYALIVEANNGSGHSFDSVVTVNIGTDNVQVVWRYAGLVGLRAA